MDLVGHVIKSEVLLRRYGHVTIKFNSCEISSIPVYYFHLHSKKTNRSELLKLLRFYSTDQQKEHAMITVTS